MKKWWFSIAFCMFTRPGNLAKKYVIPPVIDPTWGLICDEVTDGFLDDIRALGIPDGLWKASP